MGRWTGSRFWVFIWGWWWCIWDPTIRGCSEEGRRIRADRGTMYDAKTKRVAFGVAAVSHPPSSSRLILGRIQDFLSHGSFTLLGIRNEYWIRQHKNTFLLGSIYSRAWVVGGSWRGCQKSLSAESRSLPSSCIFLVGHIFPTRDDYASLHPRFSFLFSWPFQVGFRVFYSRVRFFRYDIFAVYSFFAFLDILLSFGPPHGLNTNTHPFPPNGIIMYITHISHWLVVSNFSQPLPSSSSLLSHYPPFFIP